MYSSYSVFSFLTVCRVKDSFTYTMTLVSDTLTVFEAYIGDSVHLIWTIPEITIFETKNDTKCSIITVAYITFRTW